MDGLLEEYLDYELKNSTNVRSKEVRLPLAFRAIRFTLGSVGAVAPGWAAHWALRLWGTPLRYPQPEVERRALETGRPFEVKTPSGSLKAWSWGQKDAPRILLLHGWAGRGGQMHAFVPELVRAGYSPIIVDAPAHGQNPRRATHILEWREALEALVEQVGPLAGVVAHSFGAAATCAALESGLELGRLVFVGPPSRMSDFLGEFVSIMGLNARVTQAMEKQISDILGQPIEDYSLARIAHRRTEPLLIIHDVNDREIPISRSRDTAAAWPGARLKPTEGLGHIRILRNESVIKETVEFLSAQTSLERMRA